VCALLFFATTINYVDRQVLGILAPELEKSIGWNQAQYGYIITAFQASYAIFLLLGGGLMDRLGTRKGYSLAVMVWSAASMAHALARTAFGFGLARFALGAGEAGNFPAAIKTVSEWFPKKERALAIGIFNSGSNVGAVIAPLIMDGAGRSSPPGSWTWCGWPAGWEHITNQKISPGCHALNWSTSAAIRLSLAREFHGRSCSHIAKLGPSPPANS
jgi:ACS family hexuronate transporter-like MFS transporter